MKLTSRTIAPIVIIIIAGGIALSAALNLWKTESNKVPIRYSSGEFAGEYNPGDIRGSYSFDDIATSFEISPEELAKAFGMDQTENPGTIKAKDLEALYGELPDGEIGTDSIRYFVALYTGKPYVPQEDTLLPGPAISVLKDRLSEELLSEARSKSVSLSGLRPVSESPTEHTENPEDTTVRGKTTFAELLDWGLSKEEIEQAIGMEMGKRGTTVRDHVVSAGVEFSGAKTKLQEAINAKN